MIRLVLSEKAAYDIPAIRRIAAQMASTTSSESDS